MGRRSKKVRVLGVEVEQSESDVPSQPDHETGDCERLECDGCQSDHAVKFTCSGTSPPEHLLPSKGFHYPAEVYRKCGGMCTSFMCIVPDSEHVEMRSSKMVQSWFLNVCVWLNINPMDMVNSFRNDELPPYCVVRETPGEYSDHRVIAYLTMEGENKVVPIDVSFLTFDGQQVRFLKCVRAQHRSAAFSHLSETIEGLSSVLSEGQYKALFDAAKAVYDALSLIHISEPTRRS